MTFQEKQNVIPAVRLAWIDYAKVVCIFLMVCCHAGQKGMISQVTYQFHMPAFFIISGILYRPKGFKKTFLSFGVPILMFGGVHLLFQLARVVYHSGFNWSEMGGVCLSWLTSFLFESEIDVFKGYWFVLILFLLRLIMEVKVIRSFKGIIAIFCFVYCCLEGYIGRPHWSEDFELWHLLPSLPFFVLGIIIKEKEWNLTRIGSFEIKLLLFLSFFILTLVQGKVDLAGCRFGLSYSVFFVNAILGSFILYNICDVAPCGKSWIVNLSSGTLLILGLHELIYVPLCSVAHSVFGIYNYYLPLFVTIVVMLICYPLIALCLRKAPLLLGKLH